MPVPRRFRTDPPCRRGRHRIARAVAAAAVESLESRTLLAGVELLKDINPARTFLTTPANLTDVNGTLFFTAGSKLWVSDGTAAGTRKVTDAVAGISSLASLNGTLYFNGGGALWKSDGTAAGTTQVSTTYPNPRDMMSANDRLFFRGSDGGGDELWTSDGTAAGTNRVKDIRPGGAGSDVRGLVRVGPRVFFRADDGTSGQELWTSDGTNDGTYRVKDINPGVADSGPSFLTNVNGTLFFAATDGGTGFELWTSDGTDAGTVRVKDIRAGAGGSTPMMIQNVNGVAMFLANDGVSGLEIWRSDGTPAGTTLVRDIVAGPGGAFVNSLATAGGLLYFTANDGASGYELWKSDGTAAGTVMVKDAAAGATSASPANLQPFGNRLWYLANGGATGMEPWVSDGTSAGTQLVQDVWAGPATPNHTPGVQAAGKMYWPAVNGLFVSDGTDAGTKLITNPTGDGPVSSNPRNFVTVNGVTLFAADDGASGQELWSTDGTPGGTHRLLDMTAGPGGTDLQQFVAVDDTLYFLANARLWKSDGTAAGTVPVSSGTLGGAKLFAVGDELYYLASTSGGSGLWRTDGATTTLVRPNLQGFGPESFTDVDGTLFFVADDGLNGAELWTSDGTAAGTKIVRDILPGSASSGPYLLTNVGGTLFFRASDGAAHGYELWKSDGTAAGTVMVKDIVAGGDGSVIQSITALGGVAYFTADDRVHGQELWRSDGTAAGTYLVQDIFVGGHGSSPGSLTASNGVLYFRADDGVRGAELWRTDGIATQLIKDIIPGSGGAQPMRIVPVDSGGVVFDIAATNTIWRSDGTPAGTFNLYPFLMENEAARLGGGLITWGWSSGGYELLKVDPTGTAPAAAMTAAAAASASPPATSFAGGSSAAETSPHLIYDGTFNGDKSNLIAAGLAPLRFVYGEIFGAWTDPSVADESIVRRIAREADAAGQKLIFNLEHWHNDIRFDGEANTAWSLEKMMQIVDWVHDERPNVQVGYAGQLPHGAYLPPAVGTPGYDLWHAANERLRRLSQKVDFLGPGVYTIDEFVPNWLAYAEGLIAESRRFDKPVDVLLFTNYEGGANTVNRPIPPELWRMQLDVARELADNTVVWGPWTDDAPWYQITRDFIAAPDPLLPAAATNLIAAPNQSTGRIALSWQDKSYNESNFRVERRPATDGTFSPVATLARGATSWTDETPTPGVKYVYRVVAFNSTGDAAASNETTARIRATPTAPTAVQASATATTKILVQWQATSDDVDNFVVERSVGGQPFAPISSPGGTSTSFEDTGLSPNTTYTYRVRAANAIGTSAASPEASATTLSNTGLRAHWRFDANSSNLATDSAGSHTGTLNGPVWTTGTLGNALSFDGVDDVVTVPDAADLNFAATDSFTISAWVKLSASALRTMFALSKTGAYGLGVDASNRWFAGGSQTLYGPGATTQWTHLALVQDGPANLRRFYVHGVAHGIGSAQAANGTTDLLVGAGGGAADFFKGSIDDVRIYDRALASSYVAALANPHVVVNGNADNDGWAVVLNAAGDRYDFYDLNNVFAPGPHMTRPADTVGSITFSLADGNDRVNVNFVNGPVTPLYGFTFAGGNGTDTLKVTGAAPGDAITVNAGQVVRGLGAVGYGGVEALELATGAFTVADNVAGKSLAASAAATVHFAATQNLAALSLNNADAILAPGGGKVIDAASLSIVNGGSLDVGDNDLIVRDGALQGAMFAFVRDGVVFSSLAQDGLRDLGLAPAAAIFQGEPFGFFAGQTVAGDDLLLKYTWEGDANLDGFVSGDDYAAIDYAYAIPGSSGWWNGDFNLDGIISGDDYAAIDFTVAAQNGLL